MLRVAATASAAGAAPAGRARLAAAARSAPGRVGHECLVHHEPLHARAGQFVLGVAQQPLEHGQQPARAGVLPGGAGGQGAQRAVGEARLDAVGAERPLVLADDAALALVQDFVKVVRRQLLAHHPHGQAADELRLEAVVDEIARRHLPQDGGVAATAPPVVRCANPMRALAQAAGDLVAQPLERAADDEKDVPRVDRFRLRGLPPSPPRRWNSNAPWSCAWMSIGLRTGTSVSSMSLRRVVCTPRPLTSRPAGECCRRRRSCRSRRCR